MNAVLQQPAAPAPSAERTPIDGAVHIPLNLLRPNRWNRQVDPAGLPGLAESIKSKGVMTPARARPIEGAKAGEPLYEIVYGERRWRASAIAGQPTLPCLVAPMDDQEVKEALLIENLQREDMHSLDEAAGYDQLLRKNSGPQALRGFATVEDLAKSIGRSPSYVKQRLALLNLAPEGKKTFREDSDFTFSHALRIARLHDPKDQAEALRAWKSGWGGSKLSVRELDAVIERSFMLELSRARFKPSDATLLPEAGSCRECPKRTGANADLFDDIKAKDTCTDGACFQRKEEAHAARIKAEAEAKGMDVISGAAAKKIMPNNWSSPKGYLELDKKHHQLDAEKPLRKLLAKADVKPVMVENPHTGDLVEMVDEKQALAALKAAGVIRSDKKLPNTSAAQRDTDARNKRETAWRTALAADCLDAARTAPQLYRDRLIWTVATTLWSELQHDTRARLVKLLGWPPVKARHESGPGLTAEQHIEALSADDLCRYFTAVHIVSETYIASYQGVAKPARLLATAEALGVDVQAAKDRVREVKKSTPDKAAAKRAVKKAAELATPETALAAAVKRAQAKGTLAPRGVKYRDPATGSTWTGRGLQPQWLKVALAGGAKLSDFEVKAEPLKTVAKATLSAAAAAIGLPMEA